MGAHGKSGERDWEVIQISKAGVDTNLSANHVFFWRIPKGPILNMSTATEWSGENNTSFLIPTWDSWEKNQRARIQLKSRGTSAGTRQRFRCGSGAQKTAGEAGRILGLRIIILGEMQDGHKHHINGVVVVTPHKWPEINRFRWGYNYLIFQMALWMAPINALKGAPFQEITGDYRPILLGALPLRSIG